MDAHGARGGDWYSSLPFGTRGVFTICVASFVLCVLVGFDDFARACVAPRHVLATGEVYRALTAPFFHGSLLHLALNMTAFVGTASGLERSLGTTQFALIVLLFALVAAAYHVALATAAALVGFTGAPMECAIGLSGIIFGLIVVDTHLSAIERRSVFGFFDVPSGWYPLGLLLFIQVIAPAVSFLGHAAGLLAGLTYVRGYLNPVLPSPAAIESFEAWPAMAAATRRRGFVHGGGARSARASPGSGVAVLPVFLTGGGGGGGGGGTASRWWQQIPGTFARPAGSEGTFAEGGGRASGTAAAAGGGGDGGRAKTAPKKPPSGPAAAASPAAAAAAAAAARAGVKAPPPAPRAAAAAESDGDDELESMEVAPAAMTSVAAAAVAADAGGGADDATTLVEMGFAREDARRALDAAGGDVAAAVDILSSR